MTAHDPRVTLTEAELTYGRTYPNIGDRGRWYSEGSVREIIAARLAPIRALADKWEGAEDAACCQECQTGVYVRQNCGDDLRAALDAPVSASQDHDGAEGQGEGEKARGGALWAVYLDRLEALGASPAVQQVINQIRAEGGSR